MPDRYRISITPRACVDLETIFAYIEKDSPRNASGMISRLIDAIDSLDILPHRHVVCAGRLIPSETVRRMPVSPFLVYYRVDDEHLTVDILTVRHGRQRQP